MPVLPQSTCTSKAGLLNLRYIWAKYKDEVSDVPGSKQNNEPSCNTKLKLTKLKRFLFQKYRRIYYFTPGTMEL